jgi:hypothetical protein
MACWTEAERINSHPYFSKNRPGAARSGSSPSYIIRYAARRRGREKYASLRRASSPWPPAHRRHTVAEEAAVTAETLPSL